MSASPSPHLAGLLPLKKRTQPQVEDSPLECMDSPGQAYQQQQQQQQQPTAASPPAQLEHKFKVPAPAPFRHPAGRVAAVGGRVRPERSLGGGGGGGGRLVAPAPLYYQVWDQSYVTALPRNHHHHHHHHHQSSLSGLGSAGGGGGGGGGGYTSGSPWRERYVGNSSHMGDWSSGRSIQEVGSASGAPTALQVNYLTTPQPDALTYHPHHPHQVPHRYRDAPAQLLRARRSNVSDEIIIGDPSAFQTAHHRGPAGAPLLTLPSVVYDNRTGAAGWEHFLVPQQVRANHLLYGLSSAKPPPRHHDTCRRRRERHLMEEQQQQQHYTSRAIAALAAAHHHHQIRQATSSPPLSSPSPSPENGKSPHTATTPPMDVRKREEAEADTLCPTVQEHLSQGCHSAYLSNGEATGSAKADENSDRPLLEEMGSTEKETEEEEDKDGQHEQCSRDPETESKTPSSSPSPYQATSIPCAPAAVLGPQSLRHFAAGSLIELSGGRCKRVEELRTEDFLLCADACPPEVRLRSCTVRSISPSHSSPELAQVDIVLDDQHTQDCLEVFVGFPFFVWGRGWASCCPQKTAHLWGLGCLQLGVGDVCLALSPSSGTSSSATDAISKPRALEQLPEQTAVRTGEDSERNQELWWHGGAQKEHSRTARKRHSSAPQLGISNGLMDVKQGSRHA